MYQRHSHWRYPEDPPRFLWTCSSCLRRVQGSVPEWNASHRVPVYWPHRYHRGNDARNGNRSHVWSHAPYRRCTSPPASSILISPDPPVHFHCADRYTSKNTRTILPTEAWYPSPAWPSFRISDRCSLQKTQSSPAETRLLLPARNSPPLADEAAALHKEPERRRSHRSGWSESALPSTSGGWTPSPSFWTERLHVQHPFSRSLWASARWIPSYWYSRSENRNLPSLRRRCRLPQRYRRLWWPRWSPPRISSQTHSHAGRVQARPWWRRCRSPSWHSLR